MVDTSLSRCVSSLIQSLSTGNRFYEYPSVSEGESASIATTALCH